MKRAGAVCANTLLVFAGTYGAVMCFISSFAVVTDAQTILLACAALAAFYGAIFSFLRRRRYLVLSGAATLAAAYGWYSFADIQKEALCLFYRVVSIGAAELGYDSPAAPQGIPQNWQAQDTTTLLLCVLLLFIAFLAWAVIARRSFALSLFAVLLFLGGPLFLTITPDWVALTLALAFLTSMLVIRAASRLFHVDTALAGFIAMPLAAALLAGVMIAIPRDTYKRPEKMNELRQQILVYDINRHLRIFTGFGQNSLGKMDFSSAGDQYYNGAVMLRVQDEHKRSNYLRGNTGAVYTGAGWGAIDEDAYTAVEKTLTKPMLNIWGVEPETQETVTITYQKADKRRLYMPYAFLSAPEDLPDARFLYDIGVELNGRTDEVRVSIGTGDGKSVAKRDDFKTYAAFVKEHYLQVPDELREKLLRELGAQGVKPVKKGSPDGAIAGMLKFLHKRAAYTLTPGTLPRGKDFVEYFLFENKKGYCIHFASTAVLMLRTLGIPARYAEGYVVRTANFDARGVADIPDRQAHAWAEIFLEGIGWRPLEVTPGASIEGEESIFERENPSPTSLLEPIPAGRDEEEQPGVPGVQTPAPGGQAEQDKAQGGVLWINLGAFAVVGAYFLARYLLLQHRKKTFYGSNANACAVSIYRYILQLRAHGGAVPIEITALADKAQFSQHMLAEEEVEHMRAFAYQLRKEVFQKQSVWGKVWLYIKVLY